MKLFRRKDKETVETVSPVQEAPHYRDIAAEVEQGKTFGYLEKGEYEGVIYESLIADNGWTPRQHPGVWMFASEK